MQATEDDLQEAAVALLKSMELREKYMRASLQKNGRIVKKYLKMASMGSKEGLQSPRKDCYYNAPTTDKGEFLYSEFDLFQNFVNWWWVLLV